MTRPVWTPAYVGLGSNLGDRAAQVGAAIDDLDAADNVRVYGRSRLWRSAPVDGSDQPDYINAVAALLTRLSARELLDLCLAIERRHGRERGATRWAPRTLDLDLLVFGRAQIDEPGLRVPHPELSNRAFVLGPLEEVAGQLDVPGLGPLAALVARCDTSGLTPVHGRADG